MIKRYKNKVIGMVIMFIFLSHTCFAGEKYNKKILLELTEGSGPYQFGTRECGMSKDGKSMPGLVHADRQGNIYFYDDNNYRISKYDSKGQFLFDIKGYYIGIGLDKLDNLYVFGTGTSKTFKITVLNKNGQVIKEHFLSPYTASYEGFVSWNGSISVRIDEHSEGGTRGRHFGYKFDAKGNNIIKIEKKPREYINTKDINFYEDADGNIWEDEKVEKKYRYVKYEKYIDVSGYEKKGKRCQIRKEIEGGIIIGFDGKNNIYLIKTNVEDKKNWIEKYTSEGEFLAKIPVLYGDGYVTSFDPTVDYNGNIYELERSTSKIKVICYERQKGKNE